MNIERHKKTAHPTRKVQERRDFAEGTKKRFERGGERAREGKRSIFMVKQSPP